VKSWSVVVRVALLVGFAFIAGVLPATMRVRAQEAPSDLEVLHVQGNVYMLVGSGGNITLQVGDEGVLVVDTGGAAMAEEVLTEIRQMSSLPIRYVINTHVHPDHTGGNPVIGLAGESFRQRGGRAPSDSGAIVIAHENVYFAMSFPVDGEAPMSFESWPTSTFVTGLKTLYFNGEPIELRFKSNAHTDGDVIVFFRRSDVISTGDLFLTTSYPVIDTERGGTLQGVLDALNEIIDITVPEINQMRGTRVIPGHGRIGNESDVVEYRDMATIIRDRVRDMAAAGFSLDQVRAARPSLEYDGLYGTTTGPWTTDMFLEAVYREVTATSLQ
jgi:glyoxylase-like metal-dependent hydrolase (beta-lactamase superfamily II)